MKRITVDEVRAAYEKTGLKPINQTFRNWDDETDEPIAACAVCVLGVAAGAFDIRDDDIFNLVNWCAREHGESYSAGFRIGFDRHMRQDYANNFEKQQGYQDGLACAAAIFDEVQS